MSGADSETIAAYESRSHEYLARAGRAAQPGLAEFVAAVRPGGHLLDLGCGPGDTAHRLIKAGFTVDAVDATPAMISRARELGVPARLGTFDDIGGDNIYDGIWANFSLLHATRDALPGILQRLHRALRASGIFHIGMKLGEGDRRDRLGRRYTYYSARELEGLLKAAGFTPMLSARRDGIGTDGIAYEGIWIHAQG